jgi:hypothetical protein
MRMLRLFSAIVVAVLTGTLVNSALVTLGHRLIPLPGGLSGNTPESLYASIPLMHAEHFVFPFLAHASGSFVGYAHLTKPQFLAPSYFWGTVYGGGHLYGRYSARSVLV